MGQIKSVIIAVIITAIVSGGGVYMLLKNENIQPQKEVTNEKTETTETEITNQTPKVELNTYNNIELGISFQYPAQWGSVWENKYKDGNIIAMKFKKENDEFINNIELSRENDIVGSMQFRTCEDILKNGYGDRMAAECETLIVDGQTVNITLFEKDRYSASDSKQAQILTEKGVWFVTVTDEGYYDDFMNLVKSLKFNK